MANRYNFGGELSTGLASTIATQWPLFGRGAVVHYWADKGLVRWEDEREHLPPAKKRGFMFWHDAARRVLALSEMVIKSSEDVRWTHERQVLQRFISEMEEVIRQAKTQGGPLDGQSVRNAYKRSRPTTVVKPTIVNLD